MSKKTRIVIVSLTDDSEAVNIVVHSAPDKRGERDLISTALLPNELGETQKAFTLAAGETLTVN